MCDILFYVIYIYIFNNLIESLELSYDALQVCSPPKPPRLPHPCSTQPQKKTKKSKQGNKTKTKARTTTTKTEQKPHQDQKILCYLYIF